MTASKPDMEVLAVGFEAVAAWVDEPIIHHGYTLVLCEMPDVPGGGWTPTGTGSFDVCEPGFRVSVGAALAEAGIPVAGGPGIARLAEREGQWRAAVDRVRGAIGLPSTRLREPGDVAIAQTLSRVRAEVSRGNALAQAVQSIGQVLADSKRDIVAVVGEPPTYKDGQAVADVNGLVATALADISEIVESVAADVVAPTQSAREVLAAHGWVEGERHWQQSNGCKFIVDYGFACPVGTKFDDISPAEMRAFAALAEESQP